MNIDELRSAQSKERQKSDLQQLRESFYGDVAAYIEELEAERERAAERAEDPFGSPEVQQLTNDIETAKDTAEAIYERRLGKIVKKASLVSAEMASPNDVNGLTAEEQALFSDLVERIEENKVHMLDVIAGDATPGAPTESDGESANTTAGANTAAETTSPSPDASTRDAPHPEDGLRGTGDELHEDSSTADEAPDPRASEAAAVAGDEPLRDESGADTDAAADGVSAADLMGAGETATDADASHNGGDTTSGQSDANSHRADAPPADDAAPSATDAADAPADTTRATLRVTQDVGDIYGVDEREYTLTAEDVVTLPEENADALVAQGAAERLD